MLRIPFANSGWHT